LTWNFIVLKESSEVRMSGYRVARKIFVPEREEVTTA
jgi:hypothetical protein